MNEVLIEVASFIVRHGLALTLAFAILLLLTVLAMMINLIRRKPQDIITPLHEHLCGLSNQQERLEHVVKDEMLRNRQESANGALLARQELGHTLKQSNDSTQQSLLANYRMQKDQLDSFSRQMIAMAKLNEGKIEALRQTMDKQLRTLQQDNTRQLDNMRATVDEKLQGTLEKRLGESFKQVSERLEQVYKGLGEMRSLASGVGDLKNVLTNVKTRGTWGEIRLSHILENILTPDQYDTNVATAQNGNNRVEFAVKLPGPAGEKDKVVWLPIDSKFPQEDYHRLLDAQESGDREQAAKSTRSLELRIQAEAKFIKEKYLDPPHTTDFGIMFLPVEGLYAEVLRQPGLCDHLQVEHRIVVTGPTTLAALLNSLQLGFRTLAIEKRSSEVWALLGGVKTEFGKFGDVLAKTKKKLQEASNTIDKAQVRTRAIERKLQDVQDIPQVKN